MRHFRKQLGITLLEVLVSVAIFAMVSVISILTIVQINNLQYYNRMQQELQEQGRLAMEFIGRKISTADTADYHSGPYLLPYIMTSKNDVLEIDFNKEEDSSDGTKYYVYKEGDNLIIWSKCECSSYAFHTVISQEVNVNSLTITKIGSSAVNIKLILKLAPKNQLRLSSAHSPLLSLQNINNLTYTLQATFPLPSSP